MYICIQNKYKLKVKGNVCYDISSSNSRSSISSNNDSSTSTIPMSSTNEPYNDSISSSNDLYHHDKGEIRGLTAISIVAVGYKLGIVVVDHNIQYCINKSKNRLSFKSIWSTTADFQDDVFYVQVL